LQEQDVLIQSKSRRLLVSSFVPFKNLDSQTVLSHTWGEEKASLKFGPSERAWRQCAEEQMWNNAAGMLFYSEHFANYKTSQQLTDALFIPLCPPSCLPFVHSLFLSFTALLTLWYGII